MKRAHFALAIIVTALLLPETSLALDLITFSTNPKTPAPNQPVTVSLESYAVDLNSARITWYVDKEVVGDGIAEKSIRTTTKAFGQTSLINVVIIDASGARHDKEFALRPIEIDLLWEADTYTPPFYKGKALPSYKSLVKTVAIPRMYSASDDPSTFFYKWTANRIQETGKGLGKSVSIIPMKYAGSPIPVTVSVYDPRATETERSVTQDVLAVEPMLAFYEQAPLLGPLFGRALSGKQVAHGTTFRVRAAPYFFSADDMANGSLVYTWKKGGAQLPAMLNPNSVEMGKVGTGAQASTIELSVQNRARILQKASTQATISFPEGE